MILDGEGPDIPPASPDIRNGIELFVVEHIARVVAELDALVPNLGENLRASLACPRVASMLLEKNYDAK